MNKFNYIKAGIAVFGGQKKVAEALGISQAMVSHMVNGRRKPNRLIEFLNRQLKAKGKNNECR